MPTRNQPWEMCDDSAEQRMTIAIHLADAHTLPDSRTIDRIVASFYDQLDTKTIELRVVIAGSAACRERCA